MTWLPPTELEKKQIAEQIEKERKAWRDYQINIRFAQQKQAEHLANIRRLERQLYGYTP